MILNLLSTHNIKNDIDIPFENKKLIINDINTHEKDYQNIDEDLINTVLSILEDPDIDEDTYNTMLSIIKEAFIEKYQNKMKEQPIKPQPIKPQPIKPQPKIQEPPIKQQTNPIDPNISSTQRKNYLTDADIKKLYDPNITIEELQNYSNTVSSSIRSDKMYIIAEIDKTIKRLQEKKIIEQKINEYINYEFNYKSKYQFTDSSGIQNKQTAMKTETITIKIDMTLFEEFSKLNIGIYPKLISIMLNPELFCQMWYRSTETNSDTEKPYILINIVLNAFFIKAYKRVSPTDDRNSFSYNNKAIERDTKIFKALYIQNLLLLMNDLLEKNKDEKDEFEKKIIVLLIKKKINEINENNDSFIFNYKLLNDLQKYYLLKEQTLLPYKDITYSATKDHSFEVLLEVYYYLEQIKNSLELFKKIDTIFNQGKSFINNDEKKIKYKNIIEFAYMESIKKFAQVLTIVKERNDAELYYPDNPDDINPRYEIELTQTIYKDKDGIIEQVTEPVPRNKPISTSSTPEIKYYDFAIKYFNYPKVIGLEDENKIYYDPSSKSYNFNLAKAKKFVKDNPNKVDKYMVGKINRYYDAKTTSEQISNDPECGLILVEKLRKGENIVLLGSGQSGSGKTATLIGRTTNGINYLGIFPCIVNKLIKPLNNSEAGVQYYTKATLKCINLYVKLGDKLNDMNTMKPEYYLPYNIKLHNEKKEEINIVEYNFEPRNGEWICITPGKEGQTLNTLIAEALEIREVYATKNNPDSSRSHIIILAQFTTEVKGESGNLETKSASVSVCDLAGVEDRFKCELTDLRILDTNYINKSVNYRKFNENGDIIDSKKQIGFNNYFCSDKYHNEDFFPIDMLNKNNELVSNIVSHISTYNKLAQGIDPINTKLENNMNDFKNKPIDSTQDNKNFKSILSSHFNNNQLFSNVVTDLPNYTYIKSSIKFLDNSNLFKSKVSPNTPRQQTNNIKCTDKKTCCNSNSENIKIIDTFMKDFISLPNGTENNDDISVYGNFETTYRGLSNDDIKKTIEQKITTFIEKGTDSLFNTSTNIEFDLNNYKTNIDTINDSYKTSSKEIENVYEAEILDISGTNYTKAKGQLTTYKNKLEGEITNLNTTVTDNQREIDAQEKLKTPYNERIGKIENLIKALEGAKFSISGLSPETFKELYSFYGTSVDAKTSTQRTDGSYILYLKTNISGHSRTPILITNKQDEVQKNKESILSIDAKIKEINNTISNAKTQIKQKQTEIKNKTVENYKKDLDADSLKMKNNSMKSLLDGIKQEILALYKNLQSDYFAKLILARYDEGIKNISDYLNDTTKRKTDILKIKHLTQQLIRFCQLEFNCIMRRKEGGMINVSLSQMQREIGANLFDSAKKRFNQVLIENNLLKMDDIIYKFNDYIKYNTKITKYINTIVENIQNIIKNRSIQDIVTCKSNIVETCRKLKKIVLQYFIYILGIINNNELNYNDYIDLGSLLTYICFTDILISILINDNINFKIIFHGLENMGTYEYNNYFKNIMNSIQNTSQITRSDDNAVFSTMVNIFSNLYNQEKKNNFEILQHLYSYSSNKTLTNFNNIIGILFGTKYELTCKNPEQIYDNENKINHTNVNFKAFLIDLENIWKVLNDNTSSNIIKMQSYIKNVINNDKSLHPTPMLYTAPSIDECTIQTSKYEDEYDKFYNDNNNKNNNFEMIFRIMKTKSNETIKITLDNGKVIDYGIKGFGLEMEKSTFVFVTVINLTPNPTAPTNNPPSPPYIDTNKLILIYKIASMSSTSTTITDLFKTYYEKFETIGKEYIRMLSEYPFYMPFIENMSKILSSYYKMMENNGRTLKENIIDFLESNNATTLLGTCQFEKYTKIRDPTQPYSMCNGKNTSIPKDLERIDNIMKLLQTETETAKN